MKKESAPKRKTLADIQPKPYTINFVHPSDSDITFWIKIKAREASTEYMFKLFELNPIANADGQIEISISPLEQFKITAELAALAIDSWDEDGIGMPFTKENAYELLINPTNNWIKVEIEKALDERTNFFTKA